MNICVIGAGYVGLITSLAFAKMGNHVICVEKNIKKIHKLNKGIPPIFEEGLKELLNECLNNKNVIFTNNLKKGITQSDIIFIAVGTPSKDDGDVDMSQINEVVSQISNFIQSYKIIVNKSTVPVGTQKYVKKLLLKMGVSKENFDVISNPEFLREGKAIYDFFNGDRIVIGFDSEKAKKMIEKLYEPFKIKMIFTTPETAELIKYASNSFLATKISFINELANLCNKVGANIDTIAYALGLDNRISPKFLKAGIGFGGSCFPKDTKALIKIGEKYECDFQIVKSAIKVNENQRILPVHILLEKYKDIKGKIVSILGLTFKANTDDIRESPSIYIIKELIKKGAIIKCYDPMATNEIKKIFPYINCCDNLYDSLIDSICTIICTDWDEFLTIDLNILKTKMKIPMIIDGRNIFDLEKMKEYNINYYSIGKGSI
ncbi:UDP-glucose/GDP-mannose dehydrogenase family protein [Crassaminicella thermophila]|uniref:UDP-glucose 6-dehydrogenase n=1 Tax=Crassaminicella thermophila TaxID=2599308 RepID=A0A5C0S8F5_CRATE|nr:UDP-glucose/GDP-mannose dehydrogenase family protein [Crassaminicella thermophila]QEK10925.1 UDP-glucose/GDP-mannose dehydrogenase family protein [Crassaminicella thermophila]